KRASASSLLAATSAALVRAIRRRSSTAQSSANNARANRIAKAVEVQGNGALAILNSNDKASEATRSLLNAHAVTRYFPGRSPSIVNCESRDNFCLMGAPFASTRVKAY